VAVAVQVQVLVILGFVLIGNLMVETAVRMETAVQVVKMVKDVAHTLVDMALTLVVLVVVVVVTTTPMVRLVLH